MINTVNSKATTLASACEHYPRPHHAKHAHTSVTTEAFDHVLLGYSNSASNSNHYPSNGGSEYSIAAPRQFHSLDSSVQSTTKPDTLESQQQNILKALENGSIDFEEFNGFFEKEDLSNIEKEMIFARFDTDRDGSLSPEEFEAAMQHIVELIKRKEELKQEETLKRAQHALATRDNLGAIGSEGDFINDVFQPRPSGKPESLDHASAPIRNALQLASWNSKENDLLRN